MGAIKGVCHWEEHDTGQSGVDGGNGVSCVQNPYPLIAAHVTCMG